jgi:Predicted carbamoyl transferase, NodU family
LLGVHESLLHPQPRTTPPGSRVHILGLSSLAHDPAAALVGEQGVLAAMEEGKLARTRALGGIPRAAIESVSPRDAVRSYFCSGTDALLIGSFLLSKT